jgi:hypothetical protein
VRSRATTTFQHRRSTSRVRLAAAALKLFNAGEIANNPRASLNAMIAD